MARATVADHSQEKPMGVRGCTSPSWGALGYRVEMSSEAGALDWESLRYFLAAARTKSLSGAARALGVEHTTVGRRLSALEKSVGAPLVERGPSGLTLTALGRRVHRVAMDMDRLVESIGALAVRRRTSVRLFAPTGFTMLLGPHLESLRRKLPDVSLEIVSGGRPSDLRNGEADIALRVGPVDDETLVVRRVGEVGSALYGAPSYLARHRKPVDVDDLSGHAVIGFHPSLAEMPAASWLAARTGEATVVMRSREAMDMLAAAQSGAGLAVLPCFLGDGDANLVRLTKAPIASRCLSLAYRSGGRLSPELRSVVAFVVEVMRRRARELRG